MFVNKYCTFHNFKGPSVNSSMSNFDIIGHTTVRTTIMYSKLLIRNVLKLPKWVLSSTAKKEL